MLARLARFLHANGRRVLLVAVVGAAVAGAFGFGVSKHLWPYGAKDPATQSVRATNRFQAACSERAVNNVATLFGTSDIGASFLEAQSGALPWDNMQWYVDHSPLTYAKNITTPLLILHAEDDLRCGIEQAEQLFTALKRQRKEVLFVRFPDENHEMSRSGKPRHRLERFRYILDWFAKYL